MLSAGQNNVMQLTGNAAFEQLAIKPATTQCNNKQANKELVMMLPCKRESKMTACIKQEEQQKHYNKLSYYIVCTLREGSVRHIKNRNKHNPHQCRADKQEHPGI